MRLKCRHRGETRIAIVQPDHDFGQLKKRLSNDYGFEVSLKYEDSDGELIILSSQHDFDDMFHVGQDAINVHVAAVQLPKLIDSQDKPLDSFLFSSISSGTSVLPAVRSLASVAGDDQATSCRLSPVPQSDDSLAHSPNPKTIRLRSEAVVGAAIVAARDKVTRRAAMSSTAGIASSSSRPNLGAASSAGKGTDRRDFSPTLAGSPAKSTDLSYSAGSLARPSTDTSPAEKYARPINVALALEPRSSARGHASLVLSPSSSVRGLPSSLSREYGHASHLPFLPKDPGHLDCFVSVEHCCNCSAHGFSLWHDEEKYESLAHAALAAIISRLAINALPVQVHAYCSRTTESRRIGAFEVSVALWVREPSGAGCWQTHSIHSKLYSSTFPHIRKLAAGAESFLLSALRFFQAAPAATLAAPALPAAALLGLEASSAQWRSFAAYVDRVGLSIDLPGIKKDESLYHPFLVNRFAHRSRGPPAELGPAAPLLEPYEGGLYLEPPGEGARSAEALLRWQQRVLAHFRVL